jgi:hypothetical protein
MRRFWADVTSEEQGRKFNALADASSAIIDRILAAAAAVELEPLESEAYIRAQAELFDRRQRRDDESRAAQLGAYQRHTTPAWMNDLARQLQEGQEGMRVWGYFALYDAEAQEIMDAEDRYRFERTFEDVLRDAMRHNGAEAKALARRFRLFFFDAPRRPSTANTTTTPATGPSSSPDEPEGGEDATLRSAFHALLDSAEVTTTRNILQWNEDVRTATTRAIEPQGRYDATLRSAFRALLDSAEGTTTRNILYYNQGVRTDVFLVVNKACVDSVLDNCFLDNMCVLAYEANFPQADRSSYPDGYEGWTWVRLEQLVYRFYAAAFTRDDVKMHDIWRAAQASRHKAFVSLDSETAMGWTNSTSLAGPQQPRYDVHF